MATEKAFKVSIDNSDVVALKDDIKNLKQETIKAIQPMEVMQGILTTPQAEKNIKQILTQIHKLASPLINLNELGSKGLKLLEDTGAIRQKNLGKELTEAQKLSDNRKKELDTIKANEIEFIKSENEKEKRAIERLDRQIQSYKVEGQNVSELEELRRARYKKTEEEITKHTEENDEKRSKIINNSLKETQSALSESYKNRRDQIILNAEIEKQKIEQNAKFTVDVTGNLVEYKAKSAEEEKVIAYAKASQIAEIENKKNEDLTKAEKEHQQQSSSIIESFMKQRSEKLEVYVDDTSKKIAKSTTKTAKDITGFFNGIDKETQKLIIEHSTKNQKASLDAIEAAKKVAAANKEATAATNQAAAATDKATEATKKYVDIQGSRNGYKAQIEEYKSLQQALKENYEVQVKIFDDELKAAGDNKEKRKEIEARKLEQTKEYGANIIAVQQEINAAEKREQDLSNTQMLQWARKAEEVTNNVKGFTGKVGDYFSTAFGAVSDIYKAEIASIDEDIKQLSAKKAEADNIATNSGKYLENLQAEQVKARKYGNQELVDSLQDRINKEGNLLTKAQEDQRTYAIKQEELTREKNKKAAEQEKIEKLKRKADLLKNIGEGISNIAKGVTNALSYGPILGPILAAVVGAAGAIQVGIMTKQLAKFENGGLLNGKRHTQGGMRIEGTNIEVEGGEYVINRESTHKNLGLVRYINSQRRELTPVDMSTFFAKASQGYETQHQRMFAAGGTLPPITAPEMSNEALVDAIKSIKFNFSPKVAVTDIIRAQEDAVQVNSWTGI